MNLCVKQMRDATNYHISQNESRVSFIKDGAIVTESVRLPHESASVPSSTTTPVGLGTSFSMYCLMKYNTAIIKDLVFLESIGATQGWKVGIVDEVKIQGEVYEKRATLVSVVPNTSKAITSFKIGTVSGVISGTNITVTLPNGTAVTSLTPVITMNGKLISPVIEQDFTLPVLYTATAQDLTSQIYTVTVVVL